MRVNLAVHDSELSSDSRSLLLVSLKTAGSASEDAPGVSKSKLMFGTTVEGVSIDTPSTLVSVSESGGLRGTGSKAPADGDDVTTGGSMRCVILAAGAAVAGDGSSFVAVLPSSRCCISQIFKCDRRANSSCSFWNFLGKASFLHTPGKHFRFLYLYFEGFHLLLHGAPDRLEGQDVGLQPIRQISFPLATSVNGSNIQIKLLAKFGLGFGLQG